MSQPETWSSISDKLKNMPPLTGEDLQRFSAADLDPYTTQLAQTICAHYSFAPLGHRNIANIFSHLPGEVNEVTDFEIGYGSRHVLHTILKTKDGVTLAAVIGVFAECFREDFVIDFLLSLAKRCGVPPGLRPLEDQWQRLVQVLHGVLAISDFGHILMMVEQRCPKFEGDLDLESIIDSMDKMNLAAQNRKKNVEIRSGPETIFLAAVASWLFDLKYTIVESRHYSSPENSNTDAADVVFICSTGLDESSRTDAADDEILPRYHYPIEYYAAGGRVPFDRMFKLSFGKAFSSIKDEILAAYLATASNIVIDSLDEIERDRQFLFEHHDPNSTENPGSALVETMMVWFPELRRLAPRFARHTKLGHSESRVKFVEAFEQLRRTCQCPVCDPTASDLDDKCRISVCEAIISLGLYVARMIVAPKLFPKAKGIIAVYKRLHSTRIPKIQENDPVEDFMNRIGRSLPSSVEMLKAGALLFANSGSKEIDAQKNLMGITHAGLSIYLNGGAKVSPAGELNQRRRFTVTIRIMPGWMCLFGHEVSLEVYDPAFVGWSFEDQWQHMSVQREIRQIMKWRGRVMLTSNIPKGKRDEAQAESEGWIVLD